ncbi:MAG: 4-hydroxy-tetrahydrodipicolinate reductase [Pseudomonadota bacterium]
MSNPIKTVIVGVSGRMGQMLVNCVREDDDMALHAVTERSGHDWVGHDLGDAMGAAFMGVPVVEDPAAAMADADVMIDFTAPKASLVHAVAARQTKCAMVVGTTGFSNDELTELSKITSAITMVRAGNMSLGVNLLTQLTKKVAAALDADFDIEIIEAHHRHKVDAPSGTALMLGEAAAQGRGINLTEASDRGRDGITGARAKGTIGFHAIRGGDVVGEHDVVFAAEGERIILRHVATDREIFARGAIKAAKWAHHAGPGSFDMLDVLGL